MKKLLVMGVFLYVIVGLCGNSFSDSFIASTDRISYTGTATKYATYEDAKSGTNPVGGPWPIPVRNASSPFDTSFRDVAVYFVNDAPEYYGIDSNIFMTAWYYTIGNNTNGYPKDDPNGNRYYSGWGNPNNINTGFIQLYDDDGSTDTKTQGFFHDFDGTYLTSFTLQVSGENAIYDTSNPSNDYARFWHAPGIGGAGALTKGVFRNYDFDLTFKGLQGERQINGYVEANNHPTAVSGTFNAIFENNNTINPGYTGFYVINLTFGLDNWAFGQGDDNLNGNFTPSLFASDVRCGNKKDKVAACHNGNTICVSADAVPDHLGHGDLLGSCR